MTLVVEPSFSTKTHSYRSTTKQGGKSHVSTPTSLSQCSVRDGSAAPTDPYSRRTTRKLLTTCARTPTGLHTSLATIHPVFSTSAHCPASWCPVPQRVVSDQTRPPVRRPDTKTRTQRPLLQPCFLDGTVRPEKEVDKGPLPRSWTGRSDRTRSSLRTKRSVPRPFVRQTQTSHRGFSG